jgi:broad-specificity NMP kinase
MDREDLILDQHSYSEMLDKLGPSSVVTSHLSHLIPLLNLADHTQIEGTWSIVNI